MSLEWTEYTYKRQKKGSWNDELIYIASHPGAAHGSHLSTDSPNTESKWEGEFEMGRI